MRSILERHVAKVSFLLHVLGCARAPLQACHCMPTAASCQDALGCRCPQCVPGCSVLGATQDVLECYVPAWPRPAAPGLPGCHTEARRLLHVLGCRRSSIWRGACMQLAGLACTEPAASMSCNASRHSLVHQPVLALPRHEPATLQQPWPAAAPGRDPGHQHQRHPGHSRTPGRANLQRTSGTT